MSAPVFGHRLFRIASGWIVAGVFLGLALRQLRFVDEHAVNVMFGDQWDFYQPLFLHQGLWETFTHQHGPHRQGAGLLVTRVLAEMSGWNSRWDAFAVSVLMIGAGALGLRLARCFGIPGGSILLAGVPLLFLNVHQYEMFVGAANLSYSAMPMLLLMAYCLCWFLADDLWRLLAISALTFLLIFTGFGMFVGLLTPPLVGIEAVQAWRSGDRRHAALAGMALAATGIGWALFAHGYTFQPAVAGFRFPYERPFEYVLFAGRMMGNFFGTAALSGWQLALGLTVDAALLAICLWHARRCALHGVASEPRSAVLFCLTAYTLIFCVNCAVGRVFTGPIAPLAPRYATLMIPGVMALYLQIAMLGTRRAGAWLAVILVALLVPATAIRRADEVSGANWYAVGRRSWKAEFLRSHSEADANRIAQFSVYPGPLGDRLQYLEMRQLNLFLPSGDR